MAHDRHLFSVSTVVESPLKPLLLFAEHYDIPIYTPQETEPADNGSVNTWFLYLLSRLAGHVPDSSSDQDQGHRSESALSWSFCTFFGLQVDIKSTDDDDNDNNSHGAVSLSTQPTHPTRSRVYVEEFEQKPPYYYTVGAEVSTSGFWHTFDTLDGNVTVTNKAIRARYPTLALFYELWHDEFENLTVEKEIYLGSDALLFDDVKGMVAWEVAGFLISCWLVMQEKVIEVGFYLEQATGKKVITKANVGEALVEFLKFEMAMLQGMAGDDYLEAQRQQMGVDFFGVHATQGN